ncbi:MAG TPA: glutamine amidotransferase [bacterium]|nr:glutamine amidotransferase [bacterium]
MSFIILKTGSVREEVPVTGDFDEWIVTGMGVPAESVRVVDPAAGSLPAPAGATGVVITGSPRNVTDRPAWLEPAAAWIRGLGAAEVPVLGICFGHQLIAHALGGEVDRNPAGYEIGTVHVEKLPAADGDPLLGALPNPFPAHEVHHQTIRRLPEGAVPLARSAGDPVQAFRAGLAWGVQFHPEFTDDVMRAYVRDQAAVLREAGRDPEALLADVRPSPAGGVLARFARLAAERAGVR